LFAKIKTEVLNKYLPWKITYKKCIHQ